MSRPFDERSWLSWLVKVRIIIVTFLLVIGLGVIRLTHTNIPERSFISAIALWYCVAILFLAFDSFAKDFRLLGRIQVLSDLGLTAIFIYITGGIDTSFNFLFPLVIIVASILLPRWWAYLTAALSFIAFGAILDLTYYQFIPSFSVSNPDLKSVQFVVGINFFAYMAIAYLASSLSAKLRQAGVELHVKNDELQDLQAMQENILHSMRGGLITTDLEGRITLINQPGLNFLKRKYADVLGTHVSSLFLDSLPAADSYPVQDELRASTPEGEKIFGLTITPLTMHDGAVIGFVYTFADLTEVRRLENEIRQRERLAAIGRLASGIAHEIRNPLSSIAGSVQMLSKMATLNEEQQVLVDIVRRESERLNSIISDFLMYSREKSYKFVQHDLLLLIEETLRLIENRPTRGAGTYRIVRSLEAREALAIVDSDRLKQVFWNLCDNAFRAMPEGGTLKVTLRARGSNWVLSFRDSGVGIRPEQSEKIFEPFQSSFEGGTGLGLALVYQIVQAHKGRVYAVPGPKEGAEIIVEIPQSQAAPRTVSIAEKRALAAVAAAERVHG
ncbi:MAG TPA: ATP-binding protein [Terriglobales bacterium]|nr:ATP-binding protein [Terriglobales bacterium]